MKIAICNRRMIDEDKVHVVGLPFCSEEVLLRCPQGYRCLIEGKDFEGNKLKNSAGQEVNLWSPRKNQVVFSSRWDEEKCPEFFCELTDYVLQMKPETKFVVCTSAPQLRSNDPILLELADSYANKYPNNFEVKTGLSKEGYYQTLCESKVQFNCADQDWVSFTLLEASTCGCFPIYPRYKSFPETFLGRSTFMYEKGDVGEAALKVVNALEANDAAWSREAINHRSWIHRRFDETWMRMLSVMCIDHPLPPDDLKDPFDIMVWR